MLILTDSAPAPEGHDLWTVVQQVAAFVISLTVLYAAIVRPAIKKWTEHQRAAILEVVKAQQETSKTLARVDHQLHPNGGASAHDYARKAYEAAEATRAEQRHQARRLDHMQGEVTAAGWRQQRLAAALVEHNRLSREQQTVLREALESQGIGLPELPLETPTDPYGGIPA